MLFGDFIIETFQSAVKKNLATERRDRLNLEKIRKLCGEKGITIAELESKSDLSNGAIAKWGKSTPRADNLNKVANILGTTMEELLK